MSIFPTLQYRYATKEDAPQIALLTRQSLEQKADVDIPSEHHSTHLKSWSNMIEDFILTDKNKVLLTFTPEGKMTGFIGWEHLDNQAIQVKHFYTLSSEHRPGNRLLRKMLQIEKPSAVHLKSRGSAKGFYEEFGFEADIAENDAYILSKFNINKWLMCPPTKRLIFPKNVFKPE